MEFTDIMEWLDTLVDTNKRQHEIAEFNTQIKTFKPNDFIMIEGIDLLADLAGMELTERIYNTSEYFFPYEYSFEYRGIKFMGTFEERLKGFEGVSHEDV